MKKRHKHNYCYYTALQQCYSCCHKSNNFEICEYLINVGGSMVEFILGQLVWKKKGLR